jgi:glutamyl-tRNA synthetase
VPLEEVSAILEGIALTMKVRVRFAPSPTGYLHIGGARTALFNWLLARHSGGSFILRIEDTDRTRSQKEYLDDILESLRWLGIMWDEGPYYQSERLETYRQYAEKLLKNGNAYVDNTASNRGPPGSLSPCGGAVRFKVPHEKVRIQDLIHGEIEFDNTLLEDLVIIKSDGYPTYNFACVIDDATMGITHVIRGDDHISNTPKQLPLYEAMGFPKPDFAHIPLIMGKDKSRLSKRHGAASVGAYRKDGYLPQAMVNYLSLLGWAAGDNKEMLSVEDIIEKFSLEKVNKTPAVFDIEKLAWMNGQYIRAIPPEDLLSLVVEYIRGNGIEWDISDTERLSGIVSLMQKRIRTLGEFVSSAGFFYNDEVEYDNTAVETYLRKPGTGKMFQTLIEKLIWLEEFDVQSVENACRGLAAELNIKNAELVHPVRVALTGKTVSPGLFEVISLLGKEKTIQRLKSAIPLAISSPPRRED